MHTTRLGGVTTGAALLLLAFVSPATATPVAQGPATPTATPGPPSAMPAGPPAPTLTSDDLPPGYDELFLSLADVPMGPIVGQMLLDSFLRRAPGLGPELILSIGVRAPEFASLPTLPSAQRAMHDATADSWLRAADSLAVIRDSFVAGRARQAETLRSAREAVEPPGLAPGAWMVMDHYRYQRGAQEGDGAVAMFGRHDIVAILVVESPDGRANEAMRQYARIVDARILQATEDSQ